MIQTSLALSIVRQMLLGVLLYILALSITCFKNKKNLCIIMVFVFSLVTLGLNAFMGYELYELTKGAAPKISSGQTALIGLFSAAVPAFLMLLFCERDDIFISLFNVATQMLVLSLFVAISYFITVKSFAAESLATKGALVEMIIRVVLGLGMAVFNFFFVKKFMMQISRVITSKVQHCIFFLIPALFMVVMYLVAFDGDLYTAGIENITRDFINLLALGLLAVCTYAFCIQLIQNLISKTDEKTNSSLMRAQSKYWDRQIEISKNNMESIKRQTHDLHHHNLVMLGYLQNNDVLGAKNYLLSHEKRIDAAFVGDLCAHRAANSVLVACSEMAKKNGISVNVQTVIPTELEINQTELVGLLANAFENAIEGCMRLPSETPKNIEVRANYTNGRLYIQIKNTCLNNIKFVGDKPVSTKISGGTGCGSIAYIAKKYNGMVDYSVKDGYFTTRIVVNA